MRRQKKNKKLQHMHEIRIPIVAKCETTHHDPVIAEYEVKSDRLKPRQQQHAGLQSLNLTDGCKGYIGYCLGNKSPHLKKY